MRIAASLLSCDLLNIESEIKLLKEAKIDSIHIDIMDGHFVPNIAFGLDIIKQIAKISETPITVHLMIDNPEQFLDVISYYRVDYLIVHTEGARNVDNLIERIKSKGIGCGIAINPQTQVNFIRRYLEKADLALVMGVHPGFGGQTLIPSTLTKIQQIKNIKHSILVGIDGGINDKTISIVNKEKPDILVVGSYLFDSGQESRLVSMKEKIKVLCQKD